MEFSFLILVHSDNIRNVYILQNYISSLTKQIIQSNIRLKRQLLKFNHDNRFGQFGENE